MSTGVRVLLVDVASEDRAALQRLAPPDWQLTFTQDQHLDPSFAALQDAQVLCVFVRSPVTRGLLGHMPGLRLVATRSAGFDHIDLHACQEFGVAVCHVPDYGSASVAEHAFALLLASARHLVEAQVRARQGSFAYRGLAGFELAGKTLGVVGFGRIGRHVARIAVGFGMQILAFDSALRPAAERPVDVEFVGWDEILERSDVLSLHLPATQASHHLLDANAFSHMRRGMVLVNTARGALIDEAALLRAIDDGTVAAACLDVLEQEGTLSPEVPTGCGGLGCDAGYRPGDPLLNHPRVLVTPHVGFNTQEAVSRILTETVTNIVEWAAGRRRNRVDIP